MDNEVKPLLGQGATIQMYTDRLACTVVKVSKSGRKIWIQEDKATRTDSNGMSDYGQTYTYEQDLQAEVQQVSLRKDGAWRISGRHGSRVYLGSRNKYHDFSF